MFDWGAHRAPKGEPDTTISAYLTQFQNAFPDYWRVSLSSRWRLTQKFTAGETADTNICGISQPQMGLLYLFPRGSGTTAEGQKDFKRQRLRNIGGKQYLLDMTKPSYSWIESSCGNLHRAHTRSSQSAWKKKNIRKPHPSLRSQ